ncbi:cubilin [Biomphalaria pfeifferi]|uniref:Cubilin n=1 Tax=Biomphalaria pfeifferi TaxID=112525 RepID=A0AAD8C8M5_BIOPF|nr:cubilin [Biomphalaria pfeifferi]KAK0067688.1 cubilin [Biomphalaria pfeifferi]
MPNDLTVVDFNKAPVDGSSPNYPRSYPHNRWDILVDSGFYIMLQFDSPFDIAHDNCEWDYLEVMSCLVQEL